MSYRPKIKADSSGTLQDLPLDAETVQGKTPVFTTTSQYISGTKRFLNGINVGDGYEYSTQYYTNYILRDIYDTTGGDGDVYYQYTFPDKSGTLELTGHTHSNYVDLTNTQTITGTKSFTSGLKVSGRVANSGDDEGIVVNTASNGYAGVCLGNNSGERSVFYFNNSHQAFWRYNNGTTNYDIHHPGKSGTIALTSDIPTENISTGIFSSGSTLTTTSGYVWIIFPYDVSANTFTFSYGSGNRTGYGFALVQGEGCIRYFQSATQLTRYSTSTITFSTKMRYIKFKMNS